MKTKEEMINIVNNFFNINENTDIKNIAIENGLGWHGLEYKQEYGLYEMLFNAIKQGYFNKNISDIEKFKISLKYL